MFKITRDTSPIHVVVKDGHWDAYGPDTPRSRQLKKLIDQAGGINEAVTDGCYAFNAKWAKWLKVEVTMTRIPD